MRSARATSFSRKASRTARCTKTRVTIHFFFFVLLLFVFFFFFFFFFLFCLFVFFFFCLSFLLPRRLDLTHTSAWVIKTGAEPNLVYDLAPDFLENQALFVGGALGPRKDSSHWNGHELGRSFSGPRVVELD